MANNRRQPRDSTSEASCFFHAHYSAAKHASPASKSDKVAQNWWSTPTIVRNCQWMFKRIYEKSKISQIHHRNIDTERIAIMTTQGTRRVVRESRRQLSPRMAGQAPS